MTGEVPWGLVEVELARRIESCRAQLETCTDLGDFRLLQGRIRAFRELLTLPETMTAKKETSHAGL